MLYFLFFFIEIEQNARNLIVLKITYKKRKWGFN
ncbi:Uncharacterised protein [Vibrio cholerae]|nr:Uncharacterised protein [Vibrio cholerae]